ncbi:MAG: ATP-binding cassette domain-containing protein, partial [Phycisphaerae bacterium]
MPRTLLHNPAETAAIRMEALRVSLGAVEILGGVDGFFARDAINALIGPNGAGKTTLLKALLDLVPYKGTIAFRAVEGRAPRLGYVPQRLEFDRGAPISVLDLLCADRQRRPL